MGMVRVLKRALRHMVEASVASTLLPDLKNTKLLPPGFICASPKGHDHTQTPALLPTFMLPRACMGIVVKFYLEYRGKPSDFAQEVSAKFPCCAQPISDLKLAVRFWDDLRRCVDDIAEPLGAEDLANQM